MVGDDVKLLTCISLPLHAPGELATTERHNFDSRIRRAQNILHRLGRLAQHNLLVLVVGQLVELSAKLAQEVLQLLLRDVVLREHAFLDAHLQCIDHKSDGVGLREDAGCDLVAALRDGWVRCRVGSEEELGVAADCGLEQSPTVGRQLGDGLAEAVRVAGPVVNGEAEVMGCEGGGDGRAAGLDGFDGGFGSAVLEDDAKLGKALVKFQQGGQEGSFCVQYCDVRSSGRGCLAVQVQDHVLALHLLEDGVEGLVRYNAGGRVGGHTGRVGLNSSDAGLLCLDDSLR